jgi:hypothetical protein
VLGDLGLDQLTLPLSGRQEAIAIEADSTAVCPLQGLVRRCRFSTGSDCGPSPRQQSSRHLRLTSHTGAQLKSKGRDDLQDGVTTRTAFSTHSLAEALPRQSSVSCHLGHPLDPCDASHRLGNEDSILIRLLDSGFQVARLLLRAPVMAASEWRSTSWRTCSQPWSPISCSSRARSSCSILCYPCISSIRCCALSGSRRGGPHNRTIAALWTCAVGTVYGHRGHRCVWSSPFSKGSGSHYLFGKSSLCSDCPDPSNAAITWPQGEAEFDSKVHCGGSGEWRCSRARQYGETCCIRKVNMAFANGRQPAKQN